jgi:hypothetical protein
MLKQLKIALVVFAMDFKHFQLCTCCGFAFFRIMGGLYRHPNIVDKEENSNCAWIKTAIIQPFALDP